MNTDTSKKILVKFPVILLLVITIYFLGYFRNFVFVTINARSSSLFYHDTMPALPSFMGFIEGKSYMDLIRLKWLFTFLFSLTFCTASVLVMRFFFKEGIYVTLCLVSYTLMFTASLFMMAIGYVIPSFSAHAFNISRNIMHITQSPFTVLLLFIIAVYHNKAKAI